MGLMAGYEYAVKDIPQQYRKGDIFYINNGSRVHTGNETKKDRPAIIVSCDANNEHSTVLVIVFLTTQPKKDLPTHVTINSTGKKSIALCEQPTSISVELINNYIGRVTEEEMKGIDAALLIGLGIDAESMLDSDKKEEMEARGGQKEPDDTAEMEKKQKEAIAEAIHWKTEAKAAQMQAEMYNQMYEDLLGKVIEKALK